MPEGEAGYLASIIEAQNAVAGAGLDPRAVMDLIVDRARRLTEADGAVIELAEGEHMVYRAASGIVAAHVGLRLAAATSLSGLCVRSGDILTCDDAEADDRVDRRACRTLGVRSMVVVPLLHEGAAAAGVLKVVSVRPSAFGDRHVSALRLMAGLLAASLAHTVEYEEKRTLLAERTAALDALRQSNTALRESEERFRRSFDDAAIGMGLVALSGQWLKVNRALCEIVGYAEADLLDLTFEAITHPDDLQSDLGHVRDLLAGEARSYQMTKRYLHRQGHAVWVLLSVSLVRDEAGRPLYFVSQVQDITDRERGERLEASRSRVLEMIAADRPLRPVLHELVGMVDEQLPGTSSAFVVLDDGALQQMSLTLPAAVQDAAMIQAPSSQPPIGVLPHVGEVQQSHAKEVPSGLRCCCSGW